MSCVLTNCTFNSKTHKQLHLVKFLKRDFMVLVPCYKDTQTQPRSQGEREDVQGEGGGREGGGRGEREGGGRGEREGGGRREGGREGGEGGGGREGRGRRGGGGGGGRRGERGE